MIAVPLASFRLNPATPLFSVVMEFAAPARVTVAPTAPVMLVNVFETVTEIVCGVVVELLETLPPTEDTAAVPLTVLLKARVAP